MAQPNKKITITINGSKKNQMNHNQLNNISNINNINNIIINN